MSRLVQWMELPNGIIELLTEMEEKLHLLAEQGDEKLQFKLGWSYNHGSIGLVQDHKESVNGMRMQRNKAIRHNLLGCDV